MDMRQLPPSLGPRELSLTPKQAHLLLLEAGHLQLHKSDRAFEGSHGVWIPAERGEVARLEAGSRAQILSMSRLELAAIDGLGVVGDLMTPLSLRPLFVPLTPHSFRRMTLLVDLIGEELAMPAEDSRHRMEAASSLILTGLLRRASPAVRKGMPQLPLSERFMLLVAQHGHEHWGVKDYAHALGVTRFQLGDAVHKHLGMSTQAYIQTQWSQQAMALLRQPHIRINTIAYRLGFQDPAYFSRAFKAVTQQTPRQWREALMAQRGDNYAAWP